MRDKSNIIKFFIFIFASIFIYSNENYIEYIKGNSEIIQSRTRQSKGRILIGEIEKEQVDGLRLYINNNGIATILKRNINGSNLTEAFSINSFFMVGYEIKSVLLDKKQLEAVKKKKYTDNSIFNNFEIAYVKMDRKEYKISDSERLELDNVVEYVQNKDTKNIYEGNIKGDLVAINEEMIVTILEYDGNNHIKFENGLEVVPENSVFPYKFYDFRNDNEQLIKVFAETGDSFIDKKILKYIKNNGVDYILFESSNCGTLMKVTGQFNKCKILRESKIRTPKKVFRIKREEFLQVTELLSENKINKLESYIIELQKKY